MTDCSSQVEDGAVILTGGYSGGYLSSVSEISGLDRADGQWTQQLLARLLTARHSHACGSYNKAGQKVGNIFSKYAKYYM